MQQVTAGGELDRSLGQVPGGRMRVTGAPVAQGAGGTVQGLSGATQRDPRVEGRTRAPGGILSPQTRRELSAGSCRLSSGPGW